jgi:hypothetical protein
MSSPTVVYVFPGWYPAEAVHTFWACLGRADELGLDTGPGSQAVAIAKAEGRAALEGVAVGFTGEQLARRKAADVPLDAGEPGGVLDTLLQAFEPFGLKCVGVIERTQWDPRSGEDPPGVPNHAQEEAAA